MEPLRAAAGSLSITYFIAAYDETYGITLETNEFCTTSFLVGNGKVPKRGSLMITASRTQGCHHVQAVLLHRNNRGRDCCCSVNRVVAFGHAVASNHSASSSINPTQIMATYKAPLPVEQWDAI
jgi:hypothetical protein